MKKNNLKYVVLVLSLIVSCLFSWNLYFRVYKHDDKVNIHLFPKTIEEWTSQELPITDEEYAILETRNALARKYSTPSGKEIYLFIVYSESNRKVSHPPEICYTGNGVSILEHSEGVIPFSTDLKELSINKLLLEQGLLRQITYYWFKVGDSYTPSYWKQQMLIAFKTMVNKPSSSALIRLSSTIHEGDQSQAENELKEFVSLIVKDLEKFLP